MWYPNPWWAISECPPNYSAEGCKFVGNLVGWFTNYTVVEEQTIPDDMLQKVRRSTGAGLHPWNSPGAAPVYGEGCGVRGGNPDGCLGVGKS